MRLAAGITIRCAPPRGVQTYARAPATGTERTRQPGLAVHACAALLAANCTTLWRSSARRSRPWPSGSPLLSTGARAASGSAPRAPRSTRVRTTCSAHLSLQAACTRARSARPLWLPSRRRSGSLPVAAERRGPYNRAAALWALGVLGVLPIAQALLSRAHRLCLQGYDARADGRRQRDARTRRCGRARSASHGRS